MTHDWKKENAAPYGSARSAHGASGGRTRREVSSAELLGDSREVHIRHAGEVYTLRQTSNGKLILTK